jgi:predicted GIY-YIG superfamily endonuclease
MKNGIVYLIECTNENETLYKIGFTTNIQKRISSLQTGNPYKMIEIHNFKTKYRKLETALHRKFHNCRENGEWFSLTKEDVDNFLQKCEKIESDFDALKDNPFFK